MKLYRHNARNLAGYDIGMTLDLERIVAIEDPYQGKVKIHVVGLNQPLELYLTEEGQHEALVDAWEAFCERNGE